MELIIARDDILQPLQFVANVVERKQTLAVLANILCIVADQQLTIIGTDCEVEVTAYVPLQQHSHSGEFTLPAKKLLDICRSLPDGEQIKLTLASNKAKLVTQTSQFSLAILPPDDFPRVEVGVNQFELSIPQAILKNLFEHTYFCMAQQDVRFFLNGMLLDCQQNAVYAVATNGHRLAACHVDFASGAEARQQCIIPRKAALECMKLLSATQATVAVSIGQSHIRFALDDIVFTSKLINGKFPDYKRLIPRELNKIITFDRDQLKQMLVRVAILANEKNQGVHINITHNNLCASCRNPEQEKAEETLAIEYSGPEIALGFNVSYLIDVLNALPVGAVRFSFTDDDKCLLIESAIEDEVASETENEVASEVASEAESDVASETESDVAGEAESEVAGEAESEVAGEAESEVAGEAESEVADETEEAVNCHYAYIVMPLTI